MKDTTPALAGVAREFTTENLRKGFSLNVQLIVVTFVPFVFKK